MFTGKNFNLLWLSLALLAVGYVLLGQGPESNELSRSVAPAVLTIVYLVLLPLSIMAKDKKNQPDPAKGKQNTQKGV